MGDDFAALDFAFEPEIGSSSTLALRAFLVHRRRTLRHLDADLVLRLRIFPGQTRPERRHQIDHLPVEDLRLLRRDHRSGLLGPQHRGEGIFVPISEERRVEVRAFAVEDVLSQL